MSAVPPRDGGSVELLLLERALHHSSLCCPCSGLAVDSINKVLYVADYNNNRVVTFRSTDGRQVRKYGRQGNGHVELSYCWSVVHDPRTNQLFVSDCGNHRIVVYRAATGECLRTFGSAGVGEGQLRFPEGAVPDRVGGNCVIL